MREQELKELLLKIHPAEDFEVIFTDKRHKKINGLYYPDTREIHIHNRNFTNSMDMIYTAIHELAHHVHNTQSFIKGNPHDTEFWSIFHTLLYEAEKIGVYHNTCRSENKDAFEKLLRVNEKYNAAMCEFFGAIEAFNEEVGDQKNGQITDVFERILKLPRGEARKIVAASCRGLGSGYQYNISLGIAGKEDLNHGMLERMKFETIGGQQNKSVTPAMFKFYHAEKIDSEIVYWQEVKEKLLNTVEGCKEKIERVSMKIGRLGKIFKRGEAAS